MNLNAEKRVNNGEWWKCVEDARVLQTIYHVSPERRFRWVNHLHKVSHYPENCRQFFSLPNNKLIKLKLIQPLWVSLHVDIRRSFCFCNKTPKHSFIYAHVVKTMPVTEFLLLPSIGLSYQLVENPSLWGRGKNKKRMKIYSNFKFAIKAMRKKWHSVLLNHER